MLTKREVFDKVKTHLLKQKAMALEDNKCRYRTADGKMCAVGCLIADEHYDSVIENRMAVHPLVTGLLKLSGVDVSVDLHDPGEPLMFMLRDLQEMHDTATPSEWPDKLDAIEQKYFWRVNKC